jgi:hypothetical protein
MKAIQKYVLIKNHEILDRNLDIAKNLQIYMLNRWNMKTESTSKILIKLYSQL